jgi:hypothetical protein
VNASNTGPSTSTHPDPRTPTPTDRRIRAR